MANLRPSIRTSGAAIVLALVTFSAAIAQTSSSPEQPAAGVPQTQTPLPTAKQADVDAAATKADAAKATADTAKVTADSAKATADTAAATANAAADALTKALAAADKHPDYEVTLGIGSLVDARGATDYTNQSNTLQSTSLGRATPQYLVGVSMRTPFPNFPRFMMEPDKRGQCKTDKTLAADARCSYWRLNPWKAFVNLKFASGSSQALSGFVIGGSYQFAHYIDGFVGFGFTPFNEASPGFRVAASNFVIAQQKLGNDLNYNPAAMLADSKNAFDGFPLTDGSGVLIYKGSPLEVHYRGGVVVGVAFPFDFKSSFSSK